VCRSRGKLGDCRDPFEHPEQPVAGAPVKPHERTVVDEPCSSGWCLKIMEGDADDGDHGLATERQCMQFAPSDNKARCADVKYKHRDVHMCFCKGDLCNGAQTLSFLPPLILLSVATIHLFSIV